MLSFLDREMQRRQEMAKDLSERERRELSSIVKEAFQGLDIWRFKNGGGRIYDYIKFPLAEGGVSQKVLEAIGLLFAWHATVEERYFTQADCLFTEADYGGGQVLAAMGSYCGFGVKLQWACHYERDRKSVV